MADNDLHGDRELWAESLSFCLLVRDIGECIISQDYGQLHKQVDILICLP